MNNQDIANVLTLIRNTSENENGNNLAQTVLRLAVGSLSNISPQTEIKQNTSSQPTQNSFGYVAFSRKEIAAMPKQVQRLFAVDSKIIPYRFYNGIFQTRYRKNGYCIEVA